MAKRLDFAEAVIALLSSMSLDIWGSGGETGVGKFGVFELFGSSISAETIWGFPAMIERVDGLQRNRIVKELGGILIEKWKGM